MTIANLLLEFDQSKVMATKKGLNAAADAGACHNFSLHWVSLMFKNASYEVADAKARNKELAAKKGEANPVLQKVFGNQWTEATKETDVMEALKAADKLMLALRGLKLGKKPETHKFENYDQAKIVNGLKAPEEQGFIFSFWWAPNLAHTIAFFRKATPGGGKLKPSDDQICCFEPNFGEFHIKDANIDKWLNELKKEYQKGGFPADWKWGWMKNLAPA